MQNRTCSSSEMHSASSDGHLTAALDNRSRCHILPLRIIGWLLTVCYWLLVVDYSLSVVRCWLLVINCLLFVGCWFLLVCWWLSVAGCYLFVVGCLLAACWLNAIGCLLLVVGCLAERWHTTELSRNTKPFDGILRNFDGKIVPRFRPYKIIKKAERICQNKPSPVAL